MSAVDATTFRITELPPRRSIESFKTTLLEMQASGLIQSFREQHSERDMEFLVSVTPEQAQVVADRGGPLAFFRLTASLSTANMHLFAADGHIHRFESPEEILLAHAPLRLRLYERRRERTLATLDRDLDRTARRRAFVRALVSGQLPFLGRPKASIVEDMGRLGLADPPAQAGDEQALTADALLALPLSSVTAERLDELDVELRRLQADRDALAKRTPRDLWEEDLANFLDLWQKSEAASPPPPSPSAPPSSTPPTAPAEARPARAKRAPRTAGP